MNTKSILQTTNFIVSEKQLELDLQMIPYDIWGTMAHVLMLHKQHIINSEKTKKILQALLDIDKEVKENRFFIDPSKGSQLTLEASIVQKAGDAGYSVHTGRSRNDQISVTELLYLREKVITIIEQIQKLLNHLLHLSEKYQQTIMPGYTHMQPAKPTTIGQWALSYFHAFLRVTKTLQHYYDMYNMNPLGACESYGTSWKLNRKFTTKLLGFHEVWELPQDAISSRGFAQYGYLTGLTEASIIASKIAQDFILFNTYEFGMIELGNEVAQRMHPITGSSVMAQKKNPDALELIRSNAPQLVGVTAIVGNIMDSLLMGYNRDLREVKEYIEISFTKTSVVLKTLIQILQTVQFNTKRMEELVTNNYSLTTDLADHISQKSGIGYRVIYKVVGQVVDEAIQKQRNLQEISAKEIIQKAKLLEINLELTDSEIQQALNPELVIEKRKHIGGSSKDSMNRSLKSARLKMNKLNSWTMKQEKSIHKAHDKTHELIHKIVNI